jgi:hypothetical protein
MRNQNIPSRRLFTSLCALLVSLTALTARAQTATVIDPQGDAFYSNGNEAPAFLDILAASFTISDTLTFTVDVAGSLNALPDPPGSHGVFAWHFALNTDDSTDPPGFPFPLGQTAPAEFVLVRDLGRNGIQRSTLRSAASTDGPAGVAVLDSGERLGLARHSHSARGVGCAGTGSGCAARRDLELLNAQG